MKVKSKKDKSNMGFILVTSSFYFYILIFTTINYDEKKY